VSHFRYRAHLLPEERDRKRKEEKKKEKKKRGGQFARPLPFTPSLSVYSEHTRERTETERGHESVMETVDEVTRMNKRSLQRMDRAVDEILFSTAHVAAYPYDNDNETWVR
jgi:hypothetical protein